MLASLNHPNVAAVYGLHVDGGVRFLAMELVRGRSLGAEIARGLAPARVIELATAIADGLAAAHRQQVTHRDLKPDNIMIDGDGRPKILDFGLAKLGAIVSPPSPDAPTELKNTTTTQHGSLLGTAAYMSPEQAQGKPVDQRSDVFSFGVSALRDGLGPKTVRGRQHGLDADGDPARHARAGLDGRAFGAEASRQDRRPVPRERPRAPLRRCLRGA